MSHTGHNWDEHVRQVVEKHEFEYEPAAWSGMEQLLNGAGSATGAAVLAKSISWLWVLPLSLVIAGGLWWLAPEGQAAKEDKERTETSSAPKLDSSPMLPVMLTPIPLPLPSLPVQPVTVPELTPAIRTPVELLPSLPGNPLPKQLTAQSVDTLLTLPSPPEPGRKRNRKTLFPDVIQQYE